MSKFFYRVPNQWIRRKPPDIKRICVNYLLGETRGVNDRGVTSLQYISDNCGYSRRKGFSQTNRTFETLLQEMIGNGVILLPKEYKYPLPNISVAIPYIINANQFDAVDNFTKLTDSEFDVLIRNNPDRNRENLMALYLYVKSFYHQSTDGNRPIGFYQSLDTIRECIGFSRYTLIGLFDELIDKKLLFKHYVGSRQYLKGNKEIKENVPNIYIPNLNQSEDEIKETYKSTIDIMKDIYGVSEFLPFMRNLKEV